MGTFEAMKPVIVSVYQDRAGVKSIAVVQDKNCVYFRRACTDSQAVDIVTTLDRGEPWNIPDDGEPDPAAAYMAIGKAVEARNGGAWEIATYTAKNGVSV